MERCRTASTSASLPASGCTRSRCSTRKAAAIRATSSRPSTSPSSTSAYVGIDVINLSLGHPIYEPAATDPLVRAVERAAAAGIVVVTSAGNYGTNPADRRDWICRHHVAGQRAVGAHDWFGEHGWNREAVGRHGVAVQLAWADVVRRPLEARRAGARTGPRGHLHDGHEAVFGPEIPHDDLAVYPSERHQHGVGGGDRRCGAHDRGQPD